MTLATKTVQDDLWLGPPPAQARATCVFLHGRGQSPELMAEHVFARLGAEDVSVLLPRAPGSAWYDARAVDPLTDETRVQLAAALDRVDVAVGIALAAGAPADGLVLAGFSQGACLALEYALRRRRPAALVCLTGCRVGYPLEEPAPALHRLPVYLSCGDADPWIPLDPFFAAARQLAEAGARLAIDVVPGRAHDVSDGEVAALRRLLDGVAEQPDRTGGA